MGCVVWEQDKEKLNILALGVLVLYRKKGIASTLLSSCLEGCQEASLHVQTENDNAIQFYKHRGFRIERRISNYYRRVTCLHAFKMILDKN